MTWQFMCRAGAPGNIDEKYPGRKKFVIGGRRSFMDAPIEGRRYLLLRAGGLSAIEYL